MLSVFWVFFWLKSFFGFIKVCIVDKLRTSFVQRTVEEKDLSVASEASTSLMLTFINLALVVFVDVGLQTILPENQGDDGKCICEFVEQVVLKLVWERLRLIKVNTLLPFFIEWKFFFHFIDCILHTIALKLSKTLLFEKTPIERIFIFRVHIMLRYALRPRYSGDLPSNYAALAYNSRRNK